MAKERVERDQEDLVRLYLTDIGQHPLLTKEDEVRLSILIEEGVVARRELSERADDLSLQEQRVMRRAVREGEKAERSFVLSNLRLVVSIAKRYQASGLPLLDLIQEGNLGLIHAVEKFDWRKGFKFSTYSTWWIRQAITRGIANTGRTVRLPIHAADTLSRVNKASVRLEVELGRPPTIDELRIDVDLSEEKLVEVLCFASDTLSLSEPIHAEGDGDLGDLVEDREASSPMDMAVLAQLPQEVQRLLSPLDDRERAILTLRFGLNNTEPLNRDEVGKHFKLTRERIRQIEARAMSKLRHPSWDVGASDLLRV